MYTCLHVFIFLSVYVTLKLKNHVVPLSAVMNIYIVSKWLILRKFKEKQTENVGFSKITFKKNY